jgi:hypothetical protein
VHPDVGVDSVDTAPATSSAQVLAASATTTRRRSPRLRQLNTNTVAGRGIANVLNARRAPVTAAPSAATDNVPPVAPNATADNITAPAATPTVQRNARGSTATRRNPALVQVNHNAQPPPVDAIHDNNDQIIQADIYQLYSGPVFGQYITVENGIFVTKLIKSEEELERLEKRFG